MSMPHLMQSSYSSIKHLDRSSQIQVMLSWHQLRMQFICSGSGSELSVIHLARYLDMQKVVSVLRVFDSFKSLLRNEPCSFNPETFDSFKSLIRNELYSFNDCCFILQATASVAPQLWQPPSGIMMTNDVTDSNPEEAVPCFALSKNDSYVMSASGGKISLFNMMTFKVIHESFSII